MPPEEPSIKLHFHLNSIHIHLETNDSQIEAGFRFLFLGWPSVALPDSGSNSVSSETIVLHLQLWVVDTLPDLPEQQPTAIEELPGHSGASSLLLVYRGVYDLLLRLNQVAVVHIPNIDREKNGDQAIRVEIARSMIEIGRLEDIFFTSLAPFLRRHGYFLVHAFAVAHNGKVLLIVGPSGHGKTTAGLSLVTGGWGYLANDVVLLKENGGSIAAFPSPGGIGLNYQTVELIPQLGNIWPDPVESRLLDRVYFPATKIIPGWAQAAPVHAICFPQIGPDLNCRLENLNKASALAQLLESSVDRWDSVYLQDHVTLLEKLCRESNCYTLYLGQDVAGLSESFSAIWSGSGTETES